MRERWDLCLSKIRNVENETCVCPRSSSSEPHTALRSSSSFLNSVQCSLFLSISFSLICPILVINLSFLFISTYIQTWAFSNQFFNLIVCDETQNMNETNSEVETKIFRDESEWIKRHVLIPRSFNIMTSHSVLIYLKSLLIICSTSSLAL